MGTLGVGLIAGRILGGYFLDRYFAPYVAATFTLLMCIGIAVLALELAGPIILVASVMIGLSLGSEISEVAYIVSRYFGSRAFGQINGIMFGAFQLGSAFGEERPPVGRAGAPRRLQIDSDDPGWRLDAQQRERGWNDVHDRDRLAHTPGGREGSPRTDRRLWT